MRKLFRFLHGLGSVALATSVCHASGTQSGTLPDLAQAQFIHPGYLQTAKVYLNAGLPAGTTLTVAKITPGGKVLLALPWGSVSETDQTPPIIGYIWERGSTTPIHGPAWPWIYGGLNGEESGSISFIVADMNDAGVLVGQSGTSGWRLGRYDLAYNESLGIVWPSGPDSAPQILNPGVSSIMERYERYQADWDGDSNHYRTEFDDIRVDQAGNCYGQAQVGLYDSWYDEDRFDYLNDVVKWETPELPPANLTGNAALFNAGTVSHWTSSEIVSFSPDGHLLVANWRDAPPSYHLIPPGGSLGAPLSSTLGAIPSVVTDSGLVVGFGSQFPSAWTDGDVTPSLITRYYPSTSSDGDILHPNQSKLWLRRPSDSGDYYVPATTSVGERYAVAAGARRISGGLFADGATGAPLLRVPARLCVDHDQDGVIHPQAAAISAAELPPDERFYLPINDDDDAPGATPQPDCLNGVVDGADDLVDFAPVFLDIKRLLDVLPPGPSIRYKLKQADGAMNLVFTSLTAATAFAYRDAAAATSGYGPNADQTAASATTQQITAGGIELSDDFLARILDQDQGVILVEMRALSAAPLRLVAENAAGVEIAELSQGFASFRLRADAGRVHLGFDPPCKSEGDAPTEYWASVVQKGSNTILNLDMVPTTANGVEWRVSPADAARVGITMSSFTGNTAKLTITGKDTGDNLPETATIQLASKGVAGSMYLTLNVLVLPQRELKLAIYTLEDPDSPLSQFATSPTVNLPTNEEILAVCNEAYIQAGIRFVLHASVLPPHNRSRFYPFDTRGIHISPGVAIFDPSLPIRSADGVMSYGEKRAMYSGSPNSPEKSIFEVSSSSTEAVRFILVRQSGISYANVAVNSNEPVLAPLVPDSMSKIRGMSSGELFARDLKSPRQIALAIAHELGHMLGLATADELAGSGPYKTDGHDQPPYPAPVNLDDPDGQLPIHPGNDLEIARPEPNRALMQGGAPEADGLPWLHGQWMRRQDWERANERAGTF